MGVSLCFWSYRSPHWTILSLDNLLRIASEKAKYSYLYDIVGFDLPLAVSSVRRVVCIQELPVEHHELICELYNFVRLNICLHVST